MFWSNAPGTQCEYVAKSVCLKHFSYTQGEQGYRGLEGNAGRDGARVSIPNTFISFHTKLHTFCSCDFMVLFP